MDQMAYSEPCAYPDEREMTVKIAKNGEILNETQRQDKLVSGLFAELDILEDRLKSVVRTEPEAETAHPQNPCATMLGSTLNAHNDRLERVLTKIQHLTSRIDL